MNQRAKEQNNKTHATRLPMHFSYPTCDCEAETIKHPLSKTTPVTTPVTTPKTSPLSGLLQCFEPRKEVCVHLLLVASCSQQRCQEPLMASLLLVAMPFAPSSCVASCSLLCRLFLLSVCVPLATLRLRRAQSDQLSGVRWVDPPLNVDIETALSESQTLFRCNRLREQLELERTKQPWVFKSFIFRVCEAQKWIQYPAHLE